MIGDTLVVDALVHAVNLRELDSPTRSRPLCPELRAAPAVLRSDDACTAVYGLTQDELLRDWSADELAQVLFLESNVDLGVYHALPLQDVQRQGLVALEKGFEMWRRSPGRVALHVTLNPFDGAQAFEQLEYAVKELGAVGVALYPARFERGQRIPIRLDDPQLSLPLIERAIELGVRCIAVHKFEPLGPGSQSCSALDDLAVAARYPEVNFELLQAGFAFLDQTCLLLERLPNLYVNLAWSTSLLLSAPDRFAELLGRLLLWAGEERIFWASGCCLQHPRPALEAFLAFEMPESLVQQGLPRLSQSARANILGANWCRAHGLHVDTLRARLCNDFWAQLRSLGPRPAWSAIRNQRGI